MPVHGTFQGVFPEKPDLIVSAVDSFSCESHVNAYALDAGVKTVFVGVWGEARVAEIYYVIPGQTSCYGMLCLLPAANPRPAD